MMDKIEVILFQYYTLIIRFILNILKNNLVYNIKPFNKIKNSSSKIIQYFQRSYENLTKYFHLNR